MKLLAGVFLVSCFLVCAGCHQGQGKLDGEVFIVTEGAQNVRLGLVEVRILSIEETKSSIAKTKAQAEREVANLQSKLDAARKALASAEVRENARGAEAHAARNRYDAAVSDENNLTMGDKIDASEEASPAFERAFERLKAATIAVSSARDEVTAVEKVVRSWNSGALYFASLPPPTASLKTDADGKFSIPLDRNAKVVLAANATRRLLSKTENYYWLVSVSLDGQPSKRIFLSNDNLATSDAQDSLVHVVE
jgi:hypothetical protein